LNLSDPDAPLLPIKEASRTDEPAFPQKADPVALGGKNEVFARGVS